MKFMMKTKVLSGKVVGDGVELTIQSVAVMYYFMIKFDFIKGRRTPSP